MQIIIAAGLNSDNKATIAKIDSGASIEQNRGQLIYLLAVLNPDGELVPLQLSPTGELIT